VPHPIQQPLPRVRAAAAAQVRIDGVIILLPCIVPFRCARLLVLLLLLLLLLVVIDIRCANLLRLLVLLVLLLLVLLVLLLLVLVLLLLLCQHRWLMHSSCCSKRCRLQVHGSCSLLYVCIRLRQDNAARTVLIAKVRHNNHNCRNSTVK
jgi:hypothetical protein